MKTQPKTMNKTWHQSRFFERTYAQAKKETPMTDAKSKLYRTAKATISCKEFQAGDYVSVEYTHTDERGTRWFSTAKELEGTRVMYPEHHLTDFCL